jgi:hypothetical protein
MNGAQVEICSIDGCHKSRRTRGLCDAHYGRLLRHGRPSITMRVRHDGTASERFWKRVDKSGECWEWTGRKARNGYGMYSIGQERTWLAHRFAYIETLGEIPEGAQLDHTCHNRACVNPEHLRAVTNKQNNENPSGLRSDNTSGYRGVTFSKTMKRWKAQAHHHGQAHSAGYHDTPGEAAEAARQLRLSLFTHNDADRRQK